MTRVERIGISEFNELHFRCGHHSDAEQLVKNYHYSKRMAGNVQFAFTWHEQGGLFGDYGDCVAAAIFSIPGTRWKIPVLELSRLVRRPDLTQPLTKFIALACKHLKKNKVHLLVSFADVTQKHHGGIYQSASWNYSCLREKRQDGLLIDNVFVPGRSCNSRYGTRSPSKLKERLFSTHDIKPHYDEGKHLYWKALDKIGKRNADELGLMCESYPKPNQMEIAL